MTPDQEPPDVSSAIVEGPDSSSPQSQNRTITVREMLKERGQAWSLKLLACEEGLDDTIDSFELNRPGLALAGYFEVYSSERVQILGLTEVSYLRSLPSAERVRCLRRMFRYHIPCVILTRSLEVIPELLEVISEFKIPLLRTTHPTTPFQAELGQYLELRLAPRWSVHGVMVEVFGLGVLIQGKSGVGKSEVGLELVERGHLLVADDIVLVRRLSAGRLIAESVPNLRHHMEIRGLGIIDVERLFGVRSVREESELSLIIQMEKWDPKKEYERLGLGDNLVELFGCNVPQVTLPVVPGRNIAQLTEIAALMRRLKNQGVDVARDFDRIIVESLQRKSTRAGSLGGSHGAPISDQIPKPEYSGEASADGPDSKD